VSSGIGDAAVLGDPRTNALEDAPDCFLCGHKILRKGDFTGVECNAGPKLPAHTACVAERSSAVRIVEIAVAYHAALTDITRVVMRAKMTPP
jgi:hypothetical protein